MSRIGERERKELADRFGERVRFDEPLAPFTSWKIGGPADALVVGAPTRFWHHLAGSVPGWLARHARCPVIVVP